MISLAVHGADFYSHFEVGNGFEDETSEWGWLTGDRVALPLDVHCSASHTPSFLWVLAEWRHLVALAACNTLSPALITGCTCRGTLCTCALLSTQTASPDLILTALSGARHWDWLHLIDEKQRLRKRSQRMKLKGFRAWRNPPRIFSREETEAQPGAGNCQSYSQGPEQAGQ